LERARGRRRCIKECATAVARRKSLERSLMQRASDLQGHCQGHYTSTSWTRLRSTCCKNMVSQALIKKLLEHKVDLFNLVTLTFDLQNEWKYMGHQVVTTYQVWSKYL